MVADDCKLPVEKLSWKCDPDIFEFQTTEELPELEVTIGQERALRSIDFGLGMVETVSTCTFRRNRYRKNLFHHESAEKAAKTEPPPQDWCYVYNFKNADNPVSLPCVWAWGENWNRI